MGGWSVRATVSVVAGPPVTVAGRDVHRGRERLLVVGLLAVGLGPGAQSRRIAGRARAGAQEQVRLTGVGPDRVGLIGSGEPYVVAVELASVGTLELGRGRHRARRQADLAEVDQVPAAGQAEVRRTGRLVVAVLTVVVVDRELAV